MTVIKEQAIELIKRLPDDKVFYVVNILEGLEGLYSSEEEPGITKSQKAYQNLQRLRKTGIEDIDCKAELSQALEEKYENLG